MVERQRSNQSKGRSVQGRRTLEGLSEFDAVVAHLIADPAWRRQVRSARRRHVASRVLEWTMRYSAELGCWFVGVPPQRYSRSPSAVQFDPPT